MSPVIFRDDPVFTNLRGNIKDIGNVMLQKQIKDQDEKKQIQLAVQKMVLESALKNKQLKPDADLSTLDTSQGMGGILGKIPTMFENDPMTQLETTGKIADAEKKVYDVGGPAPSRIKKMFTVLGGEQPVSDVMPNESNLSPKEADELKMVTEKAKIAETYRPASQAEETNALYTKRTEQAEKVFTKLEDELSHLGLGASIMQAKLGPVGLPNWAKSSDAQSYEQAKRNFLNSVLRKESGAVISPTEFTEGNQQYFPQPGDKAEVIAQKKENRRIAIEGLKQSSGKAYKQDLFTGKGKGIDLKSKYGLE